MDADRAVMIRYQSAGERRVGSGLRVGGNTVLTANHVASGSDYTVLTSSSEVPATVSVRSSDSTVDLALLEAPGSPDLTWLGCARVDREWVATVDHCTALGFPQYQKGPDERRSVQISGFIPTAEGNRACLGAGMTPGYLAFKVTGPTPSDLPPIPGISLEGTPWAGMSGAVVFNATDRILGVIRHHNPAAGTGTLALTPIDAIDSLPEPDRTQFWTALSVTDPRQLPYLPQREKRGESSQRRVGSEMFADLVHELSTELDDPLDIDDIARNGGVNMSRIRQGGSALNKWTIIMTFVVRERGDERLLTEVMRHSSNPNLSDVIDRWLAQQWP